MSVELIQEPVALETPTVPESDIFPPTDLIYDDGEPLESNRHRIAMNVLIDGMYQAYQHRDDYFVGGNMFVYYSRRQIKNQDFRGPDFFAVLNVDGKRERRYWAVWDEDGRYPDVIVELLSDSTAKEDIGPKKVIYEQTFRTPEYFVYDPFNPESLRGWHLGTNLRYSPLSTDERGWLWCETLGLWLGTWQGMINRETATWLRFYDSEGELVLLPKELAVLERERAEAESQRAEAERERAEAESQRAEAERQQKEEAEAILEAERQKNQALRERLQALGIDPDSIS